MNAIRVNNFGPPENLVLEQIPTPIPSPGQVLIKIHFAGVNPIDTYWRNGMNPSIIPPFTPGLDGAGVIEQLGAGVSRFPKGTQVYFGGTLTGSYAEFALCDSTQVYPLPKKLTMEQGAAIHVPYATAHRALFHRAQTKPGEWVLIHGASGGVGVAATQIAAAAGFKVIGTAGTASGRTLVTQNGAHHVLNHNDPGYQKTILDLTGGQGVDVILEMLANVNLGHDLPLLSKRGRVIVIGSRGKVEINPRDLMGRDADIRGVMLFNASVAELAEIHSALAQGFEFGALNPIIGKTYQLKDAAAAHIAIMTPGSYGKILLAC